MDELNMPQADHGNRKEFPHRHHKRKRRQIRSSESAVITFLIVAVILVLGSVAFNAISSDLDLQQTRTISNVSVGNISLYGLTVEEATTLLNKHKETLLPKEEITVKILDSIITLTNEDTKAQLDVATLVNDAYLHGRGNNGSGSQKLTLDPKDYVKMDAGSVRSLLEPYVKSLNGIPVESAVSISGERPVLTIEPYQGEPSQILTIKIGTPKYLCYTEAVIASVLNAYKNRQFEIIAEYTIIEPKPVTAEGIFDAYCVKPINASVDPETLIFSKAVYGYGFDVADLQSKLDAAQWGDTIIVHLSRITPAVTDDMLAGPQN